MLRAHRHAYGWKRRGVSAPIRIAAAFLILAAPSPAPAKGGAAAAAGNPRPAQSATLLYDAARARIWCVNQDNHSVSVFDAGGLVRLKEIPVGRNPRTLALDSLGRIWVANQDDATISLVDGSALAVARTLALPRASRPYGVCLDPRGGTAYVTLEGTGALLRYDAASLERTGALDLFPSARAIAVTADGSRILVTRYLSPAGGGEVADVRAGTFTAAGIIPIPYQGDPLLPPGGFWGVPNALTSITLAPDGKEAWVPFKKDNVKMGLFVNPSGGLPTFESTVRTGVARIDLAEGAEDPSVRRDLVNLSMADAVALDGKGALAYVSTLTAGVIAVFDIDSWRMVASLEPEREESGWAPDGLVLDPKDSLLFVHGFLSRTVEVYDVAAPDSIRKIASLPAVEKDSLPPGILRGKRIFHDANDGRMTLHRYISCAVCHLEGAGDGRVWDFTHKGEGLRRTTSLLGRAGMGHGPLHWSANFDEIQDFEEDIREGFAGTGFLDDGDFRAGRDTPLGAPKAGLSPDLDALADYVSSLTRARPSPYRNPDGSLTADAAAGERIFLGEKAGCAACHAPPRYTDSGPASVSGGPSAGGYRLHDVGTLKPGSGRRLGDTLAGLDTPTLLGVWEGGPYLHDGSAPTLMDVLTTANPADRHGRTSHLTAAEKEQLVAFLRQIEGEAEPTGMRARAPRAPGGFRMRASDGGRELIWTGPWRGDGARLTVFDPRGRLLARLRPEPSRSDGVLRFRWAADAGVRLYRLEWPDGTGARGRFTAAP